MAEIYVQDTELIKKLPRPAWHRFAIVCEGPDKIRCFVDGRETSFSPLQEPTLRKIMVGVVMMDAASAYTAYMDNLSIQLTDEVADLPESPYNDGWTVPAGPSALALKGGALNPRKAPTAPSALATAVSWMNPIDAWKKAQDTRVPMLLYFFAPGVERAESLEKSFASNPNAKSFLLKHACARVDVNQLQGGAVAQQYGIYKVPTLMVIAPDAKSFRKVVMKPTDTWDTMQAQLSL